MIKGKREGSGRIRLVLALIVAACALAAIAAAAIAEDATETTTFGKDGIASQSLGLHYEETGFSSVVARPDGGLFAQREGQVESYLANGAPDPAVPPRTVPKQRQVISLADGKSLVLDGFWKLTRVNSDGSVDTSFGGGTVEMPWGVLAAAELASGKILVIGTAVYSKQTSMPILVELVSPDGSLDRVAGKYGAPLLSIPFERYEGTGKFAIAPTGDGGALVSGGGFLIKLRADGSLNPDFGGDGLVDGLPSLVSARVLADGSVVAVGSDRRSEDSKDLLVLRYTSAGTPDTGFGPDGIRRFDFGGEEEARVASWAADGSVIVGGSTHTPRACFEAGDCEEVPMLAAFDPEGGLDPGFGSEGALKLEALAGPSGPSFRGVEALARRADGSVVAAGSSPPQRTTAFLAAVSARGALLPDFGEGGIVRARQPVPAARTLTGIAPLEDGKLLAGGITDVGIDEAAVLIRYAADGGLDRSFGAGAGYVAVDEARFANGFAIDSGKVLMSTYGYPHSRLLELRAADGEREPSFGSDGIVWLPRHVTVEKLGFAADGGVIVAGTRRAGQGEPGVVLRYRPNGEPDRGFGEKGRVGLRTPAGREVRARALIAGKDGRILVGGVSGCRFTITELLPDGRPNPRFGSRGWVVTNGGRASASFGGTARSVALNRAGSGIYLAGVVRNGEQTRVVLLRFNADGRLDRSFGRDGHRTTSIPYPAEPKAILPSRQGVLVVLSKGSRPLLFFGRDGKVRRQRVAPGQQFAGNVRATVSRGRLVLGWSVYSRAIRGSVSYLATRPLDGR